MKKISRSDLKGVAEMFPILGSDAQRKVVGGMTIDEMEQYLIKAVGNTGYSITDSNGDYLWSSNGYSWAGFTDNSGNMLDSYSNMNTTRSNCVWNICGRNVPKRALF